MFNKLIKGNHSHHQQDSHVEEDEEVLTSAKLPRQTANISPLAQKPTIISEGAVFEGNMLFKGALHLDGKFKGNIKADKITIGKHGSFSGKFEADLVIVFGQVEGEVSCRDLTLNSGSSFNGKAVYELIKIQPGSSVIGELICKLKR